MNRTNKGQPMPWLLWPCMSAYTCTTLGKLVSRSSTLFPSLLLTPSTSTPQIKGMHRQRMCDDLRCHRAKLPAPDATKGKKVIKFERTEALPQTMRQCPWGGIGGKGGAFGVCICVCSVGGAEKPLTFSGWVRERKEGKGELKMAFSPSMLLPVFLYHSTTGLFILFIYLSSFYFLSIAYTSSLEAPPFFPQFPPTTLQQLSNALFGPSAVPVCCSLC